MELKDKICVVTGAASGIGRSLCHAFANEGARHVICVDVNGDGATATANEIGGHAFTVDVSNEAQIVQMIDAVEQDMGPIDLFFSNAGIGVGGGMETPNDDWQRIWDINVMAHVWASRKLVPLMAARGGGYLVSTSSAAGLLNQIGSAPYGVTKHAAVGLAEWLAMTHGDAGIKVSVLCPQAVRTEMTRGHEDHVAAINGMMEPEPVAQICVDAIRAESFLILPHEDVREYIKNKAENYDRWIGGMRKLNRIYGGKKL
ncbi:NAD(P)-dependent dehydrogenase (short-subunit alcohol dehydrogenase family) [Planktotalea frisia]|jgi:NAD(P)-dependent dehydrogenase (short-subunit alcohol dehydrogenase family)|uniref:1-deoxy-11-beta-hydroxypentalenate dehydrogenase n=1 Tax=Planktotalea frisia TaxID=696762 RepID=A0A1L9NRV5_9RHOB|nr:SDR family oxidoreductase [Planktotalea frisia]OJI91912.1 1-deoxy-11-beta-hydroxypentalenate dehydrogenase [Planktotalea frisia]PZX21925.1 NAD(P)-dependent dehydrogenase (short-subunit alcohol dehydrogenase family) [Planktotalea frisia]